MKKNLHLTHTDIESDSRILKEMNALRDAGYFVQGIGIVLEEGSKKTESYLKEKIESIHLLSRKWMFPPRTLRHICSLLELIVKMLPRAIRTKANIIHCHDTLVLPLGVLVKFFTGAKLIYDAHELESDRNGLTKLQSRLTLFTERALWRFIDALIVVSPSIERWYKENLGDKPSAVILNSPVFTETKSLSQDYIREKFGIPKDQLVFIYVGILGQGRGIDLITEVFQKSDITSHVVFLGYGELTPKLQLLAAKHSNIHVHAAVPHAEVVPVIRSADFGFCLVQDVSLSDYYCLPNKLFEYCFAGVPVLASNFPDIRKLVEEHKIGECCDLNVSAVHKAIRDLEKNKKLFSFSNIEALSWQAQSDKLLSLYKEILSNPD